MVLNIIVSIIQGGYSSFFVVLVVVWDSMIKKRNCRRSYGSQLECSCDKHDGGILTFNNVDNCDNVSSYLSPVITITAVMGVAAIIAFAGSIMGCIVVCCTKVKSNFSLKVPGI